MDPQTTFSLPRRQLVNGIVDAYVHTMEQYATFPAAAPLQDRQAEGILATLIELAPAILADPPTLDARASFMWTATQALNGLIGAGVPQDWATHMIGHELTALHGLDHGVTLAIVMPGVLRDRIESKRKKLEQYGKRIFGVSTAEAAIDRTEGFFRELGMKTRLSEHGIDAAATAVEVQQRFEGRRVRFGEKQDIDGAAAARIVRSRA
jgi:NADP-dependent alcohol dehydrogenase